MRLYLYATKNKLISFLKIILSLLLTIFIIYYINKNIEISIDELLINFKKINYYIIFLCFILYLLVNLFRSLRFNFSLSNKVKTKNMFLIVSYHQFMNTFLPFRSGELTYVFLLGKWENVKVGESVSSLFVNRLFDLLLAFLFILLSVIFINFNFVNSFESIFYGIIICSLTCVFLVLLLYFSSNIESFLEKILNITFIKKYKAAAYILRKIEETRMQLSKLKNFNYFLSMFLFTLLIQLTLYFVGFLIISQLIPDFNFWKYIISLSFTMITIFLPIQGIGNIGTYEGSLMIGLLFFNISERIAFNAAISMHLFDFVFIILTLLFAYFLKMYFKKIKL